MGSDDLDSLQRNALRRLFGRRDFTPEEVSQLDYAVVEQLPTIGKKGLAAIRSWLHGHGYDLNNVPLAEENRAGTRLQKRLDDARCLLLRHGYIVDLPPERVAARATRLSRDGPD